MKYYSSKYLYAVQRSSGKRIIVIIDLKYLVPGACQGTKYIHTGTRYDTTYVYCSCRLLIELYQGIVQYVIWPKISPHHRKPFPAMKKMNTKNRFITAMRQTAPPSDATPSKIMYKNASNGFRTKQSRFGYQASHIMQNINTMPGQSPPDGESASEVSKSLFIEASAG